MPDVGVGCAFLTLCFGPGDRGWREQFLRRAEALILVPSEL